MIGDRECLKTLSNTLPVFIDIYTPWVRVSDGSLVTLMYACGELLPCRNITILVQLMDTGDQLDLNLMRLLTPHWSCESLELIRKEPTDHTYYIDSLNEPLVAQYIDYAPAHDITKKNYLACNNLHARHIQPILEPGPQEVQPQYSVLIFTERTPCSILLCAVTPAWYGLTEHTNPSTTRISIKMVISLLSPTTILIPGTKLG